MTEDAIVLSPQQRAVVETTILKHCEIRGWHLHAVNCRSNHVHVVVTATGIDPEVVLAQLKAWCTRRLKEAFPALADRKNLWTEKGSKRKVFTEAALQDVIVYVVEQQEGARFVT
jgi:REP element-mobilizing transposase RayT